MEQLETSDPAYCLVPAAGRSARMKAWKPLLPWGETTVCGAVVDTVLAAGLRPLLVAGYRGAELASAFKGRPEVAVLVNPDWERGMLGSIRAGAEFLYRQERKRYTGGPDGPSREGGSGGEGRSGGFFVVPADMPCVPVQAFKLILAALNPQGAPRAVFASRDGRLGHPVWIPFAFVEGLAALEPDARLRDYLLTLSWTSVRVDDDGIFEDLDTPQDYELARAAQAAQADMKAAPRGD